MNISELWIAHSQSKFPSGYGGKDVNGVCVTSLDSCVSGCVSSYVSKGSNKIDLERYQVLRNSKTQLELVLPYIDESAFEYFSRLYEMCSSIINEAEIA
ncbi:hypothetical protein, partial [Zooshikella harenae]